MRQPALLVIPKDHASMPERITAFKKNNGILTYRTTGMKRKDHPWIAIVPFQDDAGKNIGVIMAESCRLYEESGYVATGEGELSAIRTLCHQLKIPCCL